MTSTELSLFLFTIFSFGMLTGVLLCMCAVLWPPRGKK